VRVRLIGERTRHGHDATHALAESCRVGWIEPDALDVERRSERGWLKA
jgi:hypothetical protein